MALKIVPPSQRIEVAHPVFLIVGDPGSGKSTLGFSMRDPLNIDADEGIARAKNRKFSQRVESWDDLAGLVASENAADLAPFTSLVADTIGRVLNHLEIDIAKRDPKNARKGGSLSQQGYGILKGDFAAWFRQVRALNKDVLLLAHSKEERDGDDRLIRAEMTGSSYAEVMKVADFVGYLRVENGKRILDFSPGKWTGKNPAGWPPFEVPHFDSEAMQTFMADLYAKGREALGVMSATGVALAERMATWKAGVAQLADVAALNAQLEAAKVAFAGAPTIERRQAFALVEQRAKAIGCRWSHEMKAFEVDPDAKKTTVTAPAESATSQQIPPATPTQEPADASAKPQESAAPVADDAPPSPFAVKVRSVSATSGFTDGRAWTRFSVAFSNSTVASTFSTTVAGQAHEFEQSKRWADIVTKQDGEFLTLEEIGVAQPRLPLAGDVKQQVAQSLASAPGAALDPDAPDAEKEPELPPVNSADVAQAKKATGSRRSTKREAETVGA